ncbi:polysaccharide pyruvyl transferase family protein [Robinsoniella peoriensis]|uniref:polysaccharide pyruvyl transferase family protein n=1 Tax=Robinsoniella peoriensis TaxID=180332 RepID=UPI003751A83A
MKKIGLITFHASNNCGSMLQAFALQKVLKDKFGVENELIDFSNKGQKEMYKPFWKVTGVKSIIKNALWCTVYKQIKKQIDSYEIFCKKYLDVSELSYEITKELKGVNGKYDKYITGSDQVWNICCMDADDAYYLSFVEEGKKYAYAVSFGANNPFVTGNDHYKKLVRSFNGISVRESNAKKWIEHALDRKVPICLDPTMLLKQEEWKVYLDIGEQPIINGKYIFYYCFSISQPVAKFLKETSKRMKMPVYFLEPKEWALRCCWKNSIKLVSQYGPEVFLNLIKNATVVFTTSFHGTAFSTIFYKNFWYIDSGNNDLEKDDRAVSFLTQLGLLDRYRTVEYLRSHDLIYQPDYSKVNSKWNELIQQSMAYLRGVVNDSD